MNEAPERICICPDGLPQPGAGGYIWDVTPAEGWPEYIRADLASTSLCDFATEVVRRVGRVFEPAHTYTSENADEYRIFDAGQRRATQNAIAIIRALCAKRGIKLD